MSSVEKSLWYRTWRWALCRCLELFYRRMEVNGQGNIPRNKAVIFASNHTNALMDPLVITYFSERQHYFMTRGDVFKGIMDKIFRSWRMLPLFRMKDGMETLGRNAAVMEFATDQLAQDGSMIIFPEGSHFWMRQVHPLRKGLVRMAFDVLTKNPNTELVVIPVGLYYNDMVKVNQDVLVNFGEPISLRNFPQEDNIQKTYIRFNQVLREAMREQIIHIDLEGDDYNLVETWRSELSLKLQSLPIKETYRFQKEFVSIVFENELYRSQAQASLSELLSTDALQSWWQKIEPLLHPVVRENPLIRMIKAPFYWLSFIQFLPVFLLGKKVLGGIKDRTFHCSVKFGLALIVQPIFSLLQGGILALIIGSWWVIPIYLALMPMWAILFAEWRGGKGPILHPALPE
ncbi:MAG: 1-acyl-sn-glycerol-3-phosphate acyltransferase [Bacteroidota bacterium]|nr:1-acyl-sn-glycerol-3-phosphate acyltransferase [Bacteroidota bacterium]MDX5429433.1 1-acyl-sn-glycerol-3-phosphate acyltransferase [Bacteroidota bacterium]MDX5468224.1 1-acyl-sn-glycerol-3-phosphate acyltransferase [Bacteroidota bacterium]